ncbi:MAG: hypothetical protein NUV94_07725 [Candidatus Acetothermia bacterium]|nr:hypothetical protein [Candidatus Acetothermia bacterium]
MARRAAVLLLVAVTVTGGAASFRERPPTTGVHRPTAYTLRGGEWETHLGVGLPVTSPSYWETKAGLGVGIGGFLQFGIALSYGRQAGPPPAYMTYSASAKLRLSLGSDVDLAVPFAASFHDVGMGIEFRYMQIGGVLSIRIDPVSLHGGTALGWDNNQGVYIRPYAIADLDFFPNLKVVGEVGFSPVSLAVGAWLRLLDFLDLKLALTPAPLSASATLYLRL